MIPPHIAPQHPIAIVSEQHEVTVAGVEHHDGRARFGKWLTFEVVAMLGSSRPDRAAVRWLEFILYRHVVSSLVSECDPLAATRHNPTRELLTLSHEPFGRRLNSQIP